MISTFDLSAKSIDYLNRRQLSQDEIAGFADLLNKVQQEATSSKTSSKDILKQLSPAELTLLKKANSLANDIEVEALSEEGATNLLRQPDNSDRVDLNNDGIVEVGIGRTMVFPPVNAPDFVKKAWDNATADMSESDLIHLQLSMHIAIFGIQIDGQNNPENLSPQQQWSSSGIDKLFAELNSALDFRVQLEGWSEYNSMLKGFYARFQQALSSQPTSLPVVDKNSGIPNGDSQNDTSQNINDKTDESQQQKSQRIIELLQAALDGRMGLDRKKLAEIEDKIEAISSNQQLDKNHKKQLIEQLEKMKEALLDTAEQKLAEDEKRKALLSAPSALLASLTEHLVKGEVNKKIHFST